MLPIKELWVDESKNDDLNSSFYHIKKGRCLLLSYSSNDEQANRETRQNIAHLESTMNKMKFQVDKIMDSGVQKWRALKSKSDYDCLAVFVLPNGNQEAEIDRNSLFNHFKSKDLAQIPKLIFVLGTKNVCSSDSSDSDHIHTSKRKKRLFGDINYSHFLYFYSSEASETVNILCNTLEKTLINHDLITTLSVVLHRLKKTVLNDEAVCYLNSTMTRLVTFNQLKHSDDLCTTIPTEKPGICFIIYFEAETDSKFGVDRLSKFFVELNFKVELFKNHNLKKVIALLDNIYENDYSSFGCFVMFYLSNGNAGEYRRCEFRNLEMIENDDLIKSAALNNSLDDKPKIFFIQTYPIGITAEDILKGQVDETEKWNYPDIFVFTSSYPGHISMRSTESGSYFIQKLCEILENHYDDWDLATIARKVCKSVEDFKIGDITKSHMKSIKQVPFMHTTMTKPLKLTKIPYSYKENSETSKK